MTPRVHRAPSPTESCRAPCEPASAASAPRTSRSLEKKLAGLPKPSGGQGGAQRRPRAGTRCREGPPRLVSSSLGLPSLNRSVTRATLWCGGGLPCAAWCPWRGCAPAARFHGQFRLGRAAGSPCAQGASRAVETPPQGTSLNFSSSDDVCRSAEAIDRPTAPAAPRPCRHRHPSLSQGLGVPVGRHVILTLRVPDDQRGRVPFRAFSGPSAVKARSPRACLSWAVDLIPLDS